MIELLRIAVSTMLPLTESVDTQHQAMDALAQMLASYSDNVEDQPGGAMAAAAIKTS